MSDAVLIVLIGAAVTLIPTVLAALWKWAKAVEERAYERARNEALLREAELALAAKGGEVNALSEREEKCMADFEVERAEWLTERTRLQGRIAAQDQIILNLTDGKAG